MTFPIVTETTPRLEAVTPDPFIAALSRPAAASAPPAPASSLPVP